MDESQMHYAKCQEPHTKAAYCRSHSGHFGKGKTIGTEDRSVISMGWRKGGCLQRGSRRELWG